MPADIKPYEDVNFNGAINISDEVLLKKYLSSISVSLRENSVWFSFNIYNKT